LRQHLSLLETGQRLATTLDRAHLFPMAVQSLARAMEAKGALLFVRGLDDRFFLAAREALGEQEASAVAQSAQPYLDAGESLPEEIAVGSDRWRVLCGEASSGVCCVGLLRDPTQDVVAWTNASFLARHIALALQNLNRLRAAEDLAYIDDLTKLHNLRSLHEVLDREVARSKHSGSPFSVLFIDLDRFKGVNDTHGHLVGSKVLAEMGALLKGCVREVDIAGRYGGDEYLVVLTNTDSTGALKVAERIRRTVEQHRFLVREGLAISVTACVGVATFPEHATDKQHIVECADRSMYRGKETTRNVVYVSGGPDAEARRA
jgi:two-component system cell cycle response regulator